MSRLPTPADTPCGSPSRKNRSSVEEVPNETSLASVGRGSPICFFTGFCVMDSFLHPDDKGLRAWISEVAMASPHMIVLGLQAPHYHRASRQVRQHWLDVLLGCLPMLANHTFFTLISFKNAGNLCLYVFGQPSLKDRIQWKKSTGHTSNESTCISTCLHIDDSSFWFLCSEIIDSPDTYLADYAKFQQTMLGTKDNCCDNIIWLGKHAQLMRPHHPLVLLAHPLYYVMRAVRST